MQETMTEELNRRLALVKTTIHFMKRSPYLATVIAIDGPAASGKSTLAAALAEELHAGVIHMDDFYLPAALRTPERLAKPGGNVDYGRFVNEVLPYLYDKTPLRYRKFNCHTMAFDGIETLPATEWHIVEGTYSLHPLLGGYEDLRLFCTVDADEQRRRLLARGGEEALKDFDEKWIPMEEKYFLANSYPDGRGLVL